MSVWFYTTHSLRQVISTNQNATPTVKKAFSPSQNAN